MSHLLTVGTELEGRYRITGVIGEGATGVVYKADDLTIPGVQWAIKEIKETIADEEEKRDALAMFKGEAELLKNLNHPALPKIITIFSTGQKHYLVMEFIEGESLEKKFKDRGTPYTMNELLTWTFQILDILDYLHSQSPPVIFRDLKPSNIMITSGGKVKLIDFGIARLFTPGRTRDTQIMGTPGFSAPEQYGISQTDQRSDIYSLGATLYYLLSGENPETFNFCFPPVSQFNKDAPQWLTSVLSRALEKDSKLRFPSASAMKAEIQQNLEEDEARLLSTPPPRAIPWWSLSQSGFSLPWRAFSFCLALLFGSLIPCIGYVSGSAGIAGLAILAVFSVGSIVYHLIKKDLRTAFSSLVMMLASLAVLAIPAAVVLTGFYGTKDQDHFTECKSHLRTIGTALKLYAADNDRKYPPALDRLTPSYLKAIPTCDKSHEDTYSRSYSLSTTGDTYTVFCSGSSHKKITGFSDYPQYDSVNGLMTDPHDL